LATLLRVRFTEYDTRFATYAVILDDRDRMLLTWYNGTGYDPACWSMPGGGVEFEESVQDALVREVLEETGYHVEVGRPLAVHHFAHSGEGRAGRPFKSVRLIFTATITGGELGTLEVGGSTDFAEWVPLERILDLSPRADIVTFAVEELAKTRQADG
jgi:8-oxo-dGTP diphosphatase